VRVELCLAQVLPFLQQRAHLARHLRQQAGSRVAVTRRLRRVLRCGEQQRAARVLAAIDVEGRVAGAERRCRVVDGKLDQW
jgi:hypothetical protein